MHINDGQDNSPRSQVSSTFRKLNDSSRCASTADPTFDSCLVAFGRYSPATLLCAHTQYTQGRDDGNSAPPRRTGRCGALQMQDCLIRCRSAVSSEISRDRQMQNGVLRMARLLGVVTLFPLLTVSYADTHKD